MSPQKVAFLKLCLLLLVLGLSLFVFVLWAKDDTQTELAKDIRDIIGLAHPQVPVVAAPPAPEPVVEVLLPEPEPAPEPVKPERVELSYREFVDTPGMWPRSLELMVETRVPIIFNGKNFGTMRFVPGQIIKVDSIQHNQEIIGSVEGNYLSIPAGKTSVLQAFHAKYGERYYIRLPGVVAQSGEPAAAADESFQVDLLYAMREWCHLNYGDSTFEVTDDTLVLHWLAKGNASVDFRAEARAVARQYLKLLTERGGTDNYASCEIYHPKTGQLLGTGSFFAPAFSSQGFSQR